MVAQAIRLRPTGHGRRELPGLRRRLFEPDLPEGRNQRALAVLFVDEPESLGHPSPRERDVAYLESSRRLIAPVAITGDVDTWSAAWPDSWSLRVLVDAAF